MGLRARQVKTHLRRLRGRYRAQELLLLREIVRGRLQTPATSTWRTMRGVLQAYSGSAALNSAVSRACPPSGRANIFSAMNTNVLYYGDNLDILRHHIPGESIDLICLGPLALHLLSV